MDLTEMLAELKTERRQVEEAIICAGANRRGSRAASRPTAHLDDEREAQRKTKKE